MRGSDRHAGARDSGPPQRLTSGRSANTPHRSPGGLRRLPWTSAPKRADRRNTTATAPNSSRRGGRATAAPREVQHARGRHATLRQCGSRGLRGPAPSSTRPRPWASAQHRHVWCGRQFGPIRDVTRQHTPASAEHLPSGRTAVLKLRQPTWLTHSCGRLGSGGVQTASESAKWSRKTGMSRHFLKRWLVVCGAAALH